MSGFVEGIDRSQSSLFPAELEDYVAEDNLVRAVDAFVDGLDLGKLGCEHPADDVFVEMSKACAISCAMRGQPTRG
jgi:transposase